MPITFTIQERQSLLNTLGRGRAFAINASALAQTLGYPTGGNQPKLRKLIKECIEHDMDLIGASTGQPKGFFIIDITVESEFDAYIKTLKGRIESNNTRRNSLITRWNADNPENLRSTLTISVDQ